MDLVLRDVEPADIDKGLIELLSQLTTVGKQDREVQAACIQELLALQQIYKLIVVEDTKSGKVVATAKLLIERKLTRSCGKCAHVEDVVVDEAYRGHSLGKRLLEALVLHARHVGCYKLILDCAESNVRFYEKCGLTRKEVQMAIYLE